MRCLFLLLLLCATPASADVFMFETPSGNIQCSVGVEVNHADIHCEIVNRQGPTALPRPPDCAAPWGHSFQMTERGPVLMTCGGPPQDFKITEKAPYGVTGTRGRDFLQVGNHRFYLQQRRRPRVLPVATIATGVLNTSFGKGQA